MWLLGVRCLSAWLRGSGLGVRRRLLAPVRMLALLAVVGLLALSSVTAWSLLAIRGHLLSVLHASLHAHGVALRPWWAIALPRVRPTLLGAWRGALMGLLGVGAGPIRLAPHLHLIHGAWRLVSTQWLPCTSRAHGWRVMCPLLPTRMAPTILAATAQVCWSLITPFLVVIIVWWVVWVAPR